MAKLKTFRDKNGMSAAVYTQITDVEIESNGLMTYDRQIKKDAFYFYKANWNSAPTLYLADRRYTRRTQLVTVITAYSNLPEVELFLTGQSLGRQRPSATRVARWEQVTLRPGPNQVQLRGKSGGKTLEDRATWVLN